MSHKNTVQTYTSPFDTEIKSGISVNSGALAVVDKNIHMELDEFGFYQPVLRGIEYKQLAIEKTLARVSAMSDQSPNEDQLAIKLFSDIKGIEHREAIGYYLELYAGHVTEGSFRQNGSSGGFTTWLLVTMLKQGLIDGVIHVKESHDDDGILFKYGISRTEKEIIEGAKSRYYPAEFSNAINEIKSSNGKYAITGIPSFITEIRLLAREDSVIADRIKFTIGLICGHQKSTKYAECLAWQHGIKPGNLKSINFRKKNPGHPASDYLTEMVGIVDGKQTTIVKAQAESFVSDWAYGFFKAKLSDFTDDALNETADIAVGDAWLDNYVYDSGGNNVLIVRNPEILRLINEGINANKLHLDIISEEDVIKSQSGLVHHTRDEIGYRLYKMDRHKKWHPTKRFPASNKLPFIRKQVQNVRWRIATKSHLAYREAVKRDDWNYFVNKMKWEIKIYKLLYKIIKFQKLGPKWVFRRIIAKLFGKIPRQSKLFAPR